MLKTALAATLVVVALLAAMVALGGCGGGGNPAPTPAVMIVLPGYGGMIPHGVAGPPFNSFEGPVGEYTFSVLPAMGSTTLPPPDAKYSVSVAQVASSGGADGIKNIVPDSAGLYNLSPPGFYRARAYQAFGTRVVRVAECWVQTGNFPPPVEN